MSSQHNNGSQPQQSSETTSETTSDDTIVVWREVKYYRSLGGCRVDGVYADFREVFNGWTKERFQKVHPEALREMKYALRRAGVYTGPLRKHAAEALADLAQLPCVENGMWPPAPKWDHSDFLTAVFIPCSEAQDKQKAEKEMIQRQRSLQPQPALPPAPFPQAPAAQGQHSAQLVTQPTIPSAHQAQRLLGPLTNMQAQPGPAMIQGAVPQIPRAPRPALPAAVPVPPRQAQTSDHLRRLAVSQLRAREAAQLGRAYQAAQAILARQIQQQPVAQPQTNLPPSNAGATRSPQPSLRRPPGVGTNRNHRLEPYPSSNSPFRSTPLQRAAAISGNQPPMQSTMPVHGQTGAKDDSGNGNGNKK